MACIIVICDELASGQGILSEMLVGHELIERSSEDWLLSSDLPADMVLIDQAGASRFGLDVLAALKQSPVAHLPVIVIANASGEDVIEAMRLGAFDHLNRPVLADELRAVVARASRRPSLAGGLALRAEPDVLCGSSAAIRSVEKLVGAAAASNAAVLIQGETGTGKGTVARAIHRHSGRSLQGLTVVDCTAVPEDYGSFQSLAPGAQGSVILDEVGDLSSRSQALLVRALNEVEKEGSGEPGARVIATTQYDLINLVKEKRFREDLFYRLNVLPLVLPPLRARGADILALADTFLQQASPQAKTLSSAAAKMLLDSPWPGNVRQLENLMYHLSVTVRAAVIEASDLDARMLGLNVDGDGDGDRESGSLAQDDELNYHLVIAAVEKRLLERALAAAAGSRTEAARLLGINRQLLYAKLKTHGLGK